MSIRTRIALVVAAGSAVLIGMSAGALAAPAVGATGSHATSMCGTRTTAPKYKHVIVILEENHSYGSVVHSPSAPFINSVIAACGIATNYHNITHYSLPNYLGIASGGSLGQLSPYLNDCSPLSCPSLVTSNNIFNELASRGWKSFAESMPKACDRSSSGNYAPKHNPAVYFSDLRRKCATRDLPLGTTHRSALLRAFSRGRTAPALSFVTPNLCNDMHDCSVRTGDHWLKTWLTLITRTKVYRQHSTAVFIVWDEGEPGFVGENCVSKNSDPSCHVAAIVVAPSVKRGTQVSTSFSHYSLLKTIENLLGVREPGAASIATSMARGFNL